MMRIDRVIHYIFGATIAVLLLLATTYFIESARISELLRHQEEVAELLSAITERNALAMSYVNQPNDISRQALMNTDRRIDEELANPVLQNIDASLYEKITVEREDVRTLMPRFVDKETSNISRQSLFQKILLDSSDTFLRIQDLRDVIATKISQLQYTLGLIILSITVGLMLVAFISSAFLSRQLSKPLRLLGKTAEQMKVGNWEQPHMSTHIGELRLVLNAFRLMSERLKSSYTELEERVEIRTKALAEAAARSSAIIGSVGEGLIVTDIEGKIQQINHRFTELLGWTEDEVKGRQLTEVVQVQEEDGTTIPEDRRMIQRALREEVPLYYSSAEHKYFVRKDGTRFPAAITMARIVQDERLIGAVEVFHDVTRVREIDRAKTEFVSLASHQLRTPLAIFHWYLEKFRRDFESLPLKKKFNYLRELDIAHRRMSQIVDALLSAARIELGTFRHRPEPINLSKTIRRAAHDLELRLSDRLVTLTLDIPHSSVIYGDESSIHMVFQNLMANAIIYSFPRGTVNVRAWQSNDTVHVSISDQGIGIPKNEQGRIFDKLFRAENAKQHGAIGSGLGLYIVRSVVDQHNGKIWFTSELDNGTTFYIDLPCPRAPVEEILETSTTLRAS